LSRSATEVMPPQFTAIHRGPVAHHRTGEFSMPILLGKIIAGASLVQLLQPPGLPKVLVPSGNF